MSGSEIKERKQFESQKYEDQEDKQNRKNSLSEEDKKVYTKIMGSINRMSKKIQKAKEKAPLTPHNNQEAPQQFDRKKTSVKQIAQKLIESKQNSEIISKENLIADVQSSFEQLVVDVYSQNQQLKTKIQSLVAIIRSQNRKINQHIIKQNKLKQENQVLRSQNVNAKDSQLMNNYSSAKPVKNLENSKVKTRIKTYNDQGEDYDFWNIPQKESSQRKNNYGGDSNFWGQDRNIEQSVFLTQQISRNRR